MPVVYKNTSYPGRAAELLTCFEFAMRGFGAVINSFPGAKVDILVETHSGRFLRCQVKSTLSPARHLKKTKSVGRGCERTRLFGTAPKWGTKYQFKLGEGTEGYAAAGVDLFAFVALDIRKILYLPAEELVNGNNRTSKHFGVQSFLEKAEGSLERCLATLAPA